MLHVALDIRTLSFITVLFAFGFGTGLITFGIAHSTYYGIKQVGMGLLLIGAGCLLIGLREDAPAALSIVAANTGIGGGFLLMNLGIRSFRKLPRAETLFGIPVVVLIAVSLAYYTYVQFSCNYRVFWFSLFTFILSAMCFRSILQGTERMLAPQKVIAAALGLFSAFAVLRSWLALNETTMQEFMKAGTIHAMAFLAVILVMVAVSFGLVWLANEQLLQEHHQYESIIATTPNGIALVDREGRYQMVNDAILQFLGLTREGILGKKSSDLFGREMYESITLPNVQAAFAGETRETSTWLELPGGKKLYLSVTYHPVPDAKGKNSYTAIHIKDMTELHFAQKEKQRIFDLSLDLFCIGRMDGHFIEVNPAWSRTLGWSEKELLAMPWMDLAHPDDRQASIEASKPFSRGSRSSTL